MFASFVHGRHESDFPPSRHAELLDDLVHADGEHTDVSLRDVEGWTLSFFRSGYVVFENVEDEVDRSKYLRDVSREQQLQLMAWLSEGELELILELDWRDRVPRR
jgi:hypothetical protein